MALGFYTSKQLNKIIDMYCRCCYSLYGGNKSYDDFLTELMNEIKDYISRSNGGIVK